MKRFGPLKAMKFAVIGVVFVCAISFVVMSLWNALMPAIFGFRAIGFWQALGLLVLSKILFGGFRPSRGGPMWRRRMMERWEQMSPEERERFKQGMRRGCGRGPVAPEEARA